MNKLIPFGKYKGQPVEILLSDPEYSEWLQGQEWLGNRYPDLRTLIINNFAAPTETPEHNTMQGLFLNDEFCVKFLMKLQNKYKTYCGFTVGGKNFEKNGIDVLLYDWEIHFSKIAAEYVGPCNDPLENWYWRNYGESRRRSYKEMNDSLQGRETKEIIEKITTEHIAWLKYKDETIKFAERGIEIKPCVGDDYPAILRQIKSIKKNYKSVLFLREYTGAGISEEQFIKLFNNEHIEVIFERDIQ